MKLRQTLPALIVLGLVAVAPATASATVTADVLHAKLDGASVFPGPGDMKAKGTFQGKIKKGEFCYKLKVKKLDGITDAGIYSGEAGATGDLLLSLETDKKGAKGCTTIVADADDTTSTLSESEVAALLANPEQYYVQVDTEAYPDGAVRGQLK